MELHYQNLFACSTAPQVYLYASVSSTRSQSDLLALCHLLICFLTSCFAVESSSVVEVVPTKFCDVCADRLNLRGVMAGVLQQTAVFQAQQVFRLDRHDMSAYPERSGQSNLETSFFLSNPHFLWNNRCQRPGCSLMQR